MSGDLLAPLYDALGVRPGADVHLNGADGLEFRFARLHRVTVLEADGALAVLAVHLAHEETPDRPVCVPWHAVHTLEPAYDDQRPPARSKILSDDESAGASVAP